MLRRFNLIGIILFLAWISFMPEPVHHQYRNIINVFLVILLLIAAAREEFNIRAIFNKHDIFLAVFALSMLAGVIFAEDKKLALRRYDDLFIPLSLLYYLFKMEFTRENRLPIIRSICFFGAIVALFGILEFIFLKNIIYTDFVENIFYPPFIGHQAISTQFHPAVLGTFLMVCIAFCLVLIRRNPAFEKNLGIICLILIISGLFLAFSRGSLLGAITCSWIYFWRRNRLLFIKIFVISLAVFIFLFIFVGKINNNLYRFSVVSPAQGKIFEARIARLLTTYEVFKDHPFVGLGLDNFRKNYNKYSSAPRSKEVDKVPDNVYLLFLSEAGIIGLFGFLIFIWQTIRAAFSHFRRIDSMEEKEILIILIASFTGLLANMNTYDLLYWNTPLFLFAILAGMLLSFKKCARL